MEKEKKFVKRLRDSQNSIVKKDKDVKKGMGQQ
jgi:hypothetical protein